MSRQNIAAIISRKENRVLLIIGLLLLLGAIFLLISNNVPKQVSGEAFYDFHYADRYPWSSSWIEYYFQRVRARPMAAVYFSGLYELTGYNPPLLYLASMLLVSGTALCLGYFIRRLKIPLWIIGLCVVALALLPLNITSLFALKKAHHIFAWFALSLALIFFYQWIRTKQNAWLILGTLSYLAGVHAYEATLLLLPAAGLLGREHIKTRKDFWRILLTLVGITVIGIVSIFLIEYVKSGRSVMNFYGDSGMEQWLIRFRFVFIEFPIGVWNGGLFSLFYSPPPWVNVIAQVFLLITLVVVLAGLFLTLRRNKSHGNFDAINLTLAGLWLSFAGYLPFTLANQPPDNDGLGGAGIGLMFLAIAATLNLSHWGLKRIAQIFLVGFTLFWIASGMASYSAALQTAAETDHRITNFVVTLKDQVPAVREGTEFIFVQAGLGRTGCIGAMNMIFAREKLHCLHFFDNDTQETYTRNADSLVDDRGREYELSFIILTMDGDGNAMVLDQITEDQFPLLPITWVSGEPITTDYSLILPDPSEEEYRTAIYIYSLGIR